MKLYAMGFTDRSDRVRWMLEELNLKYENIFLNKQAGDLNKDEYRKINPTGRVPTLDDNGIIIHESAGICLYLADRYAYVKRLAPEITDMERAAYCQWMSFSTASLETVVAKMFYLDHLSVEEKNTALKEIEVQCRLLSLALEPILSKQDFILKSGFSAADVMLGAIIPGAGDFLYNGNPGIKKYIDRLMTRDAAIKAKVF